MDNRNARRKVTPDPLPPAPLALLDGALILVGTLLLFDGIRSFLNPDVSLLSILVRLPKGRPLPPVAGLLLGAAFVIRFRWTLWIFAPSAAIAAWNVGEYWLLRSRGLDGAPPPFSLATLLLLTAAGWRSRLPVRRLRLFWCTTGALLATPCLLLLHLFTFGATNYVRKADAIVVFGAGVTAGGSPSLALSNRLEEAIRLYRAQVAPILVLSGGDCEVSVMRRFTLQKGVPEEAIELDPTGVNTFATLTNLRYRRVVAVSHYYHLARIKLMARRLGVECYTVPCSMTRRLTREPWYVARECAAFAAYYLFYRP